MSESSEIITEKEKQHCLDSKSGKYLPVVYIIGFSLIIDLVFIKYREAYYPYIYIAAFYIPGIVTVLFAYFFTRSAKSVIYGSIAGIMYSLLYLVSFVFLRSYLIVFLGYTLPTSILSIYVSIITFLMIKWVKSLFFRENINNEKLDSLPIQPLAISIISSIVVVLLFNFYYKNEIICGMLPCMWFVIGFFAALINLVILLKLNKKESHSQIVYNSTFCSFLITLLPPVIFILQIMYNILIVPIDVHNDIFPPINLVYIGTAFLIYFSIFLSIFLVPVSNIVCKIIAAILE